MDLYIYRVQLWNSWSVILSAKAWLWSVSDNLVADNIVQYDLVICLDKFLHKYFVLFALMICLSGAVSKN